MFFEITNKDLNITQIGEVIAEKKKSGLTPEDAIEILGMTNHYTHIKSVITEINKLSKEDRLAYKDFVVGAVDSRKVSDENYGQLLRLADEGDYYLEFRASNMKEKYYDEKTVQTVEGAENGMINIEASQIAGLLGEGLKVQVESCRSDIYLEDMDLSRFDYLKMAKKNSVFLGRSDAQNDYNKEYCVDRDYFIMPRCLDVGDTIGVHFTGCDFSGTEELNIREVDFVRFKDVFFPKKLDLSKCGEVSCGDAWDEEKECLEGIEEIKFKNKAQADEFFENTKDFNGKIIYADEPQNPVSQVVRGNDIDR